VRSYKVNKARLGHILTNRLPLNVWASELGVMHVHGKSPTRRWFNWIA
jgi:hypothetical protein